MEVFQVAHDIANDYFNCNTKNSCSLTHNISKHNFHCILYYSIDDQVGFPYEMNLFNRLHDDF